MVKKRAKKKDRDARIALKRSRDKKDKILTSKQMDKELKKDKVAELTEKVETAVKKPVQERTKVLCPFCGKEINVYESTLINLLTYQSKEIHAINNTNSFPVSFDIETKRICTPCCMTKQFLYVTNEGQVCFKNPKPK